MRQLNDTVINLVTGATTNSDPILTENIFAMSVMAEGGGTEVGVCKIQVSNSNPQGSSDTIVWADLTGATVNVTAGSVVLITKVDICYQYVRIVYTHSSGTGSTRVTVKALGA